MKQEVAAVATLQAVGSARSRPTRQQGSLHQHPKNVEKHGQSLHHQAEGLGPLQTCLTQPQVHTQKERCKILPSGRKVLHTKNRKNAENREQSTQKQTGHTESVAKQLTPNHSSAAKPTPRKTQTGRPTARRRPITRSEEREGCNTAGHNKARPLVCSRPATKLPTSSSTTHTKTPPSNAATLRQSSTQTAVQPTATCTAE